MSFDLEVFVLSSNDGGNFDEFVVVKGAGEKKYLRGVPLELGFCELGSP